MMDDIKKSNLEEWDTVRDDLTIDIIKKLCVRFKLSCKHKKKVELQTRIDEFVSTCNYELDFDDERQKQHS